MKKSAKSSSACLAERSHELITKGLLFACFHGYTKILNTQRKSFIQKPFYWALESYHNSNVNEFGSVVIRYVANSSNILATVVAPDHDQKPFITSRIGIFGHDRFGVKVAYRVVDLVANSEATVNIGNSNLLVFTAWYNLEFQPSKTW